MMSILKNISFEAVIAYTAIIIPAIIWEIGRAHV